MTEFFASKHIHKHYFVKNIKEFEAIDPDKFGAEDLYVLREYALLMCNSPCNDIKKVIIRKELKLDGN